MERAALWAGPEPDAEGFDLLAAVSAAAASLAGWKEPVDDDKLLAVSVSLFAHSLAACFRSSLCGAVRRIKR